MRLYIGNLAASVTLAELQDVLKDYVVSGDCSVMKSNKKAFAIVNVEDGDKAVRNLNGVLVKGNKVRVLKAVERNKNCVCKVTQSVGRCKCCPLD